MKTKTLLILTQNQNRMKKTLLLFAVLLGFISVNAQNNPFAELGYEPKIATLSNGQFNESFDNDTIVQIGSIMFNTKSQQIVAFVVTDTMYSEATLEPDIVSRWISPDPLADHPNQVDKSPYQYAWNNPVLFTDPDGRCPFCPWLDAVVDVGFIVYDVGLLATDYINTGTTKGEDWAALTADVASIAVPMTVGAGLAARAAYKTAKTVDKVVDANKVAKTVKKIGPAGDAGATVTKQVPSDWTMKTSKNKQGTVFKDPKNPSGNNVRVQSGNPKSPNSAQQKPYVKQTQNGKTVDVNGKQVNPKSQEAHIPKEDFKFKKD